MTETTVDLLPSVRAMGEGLASAGEGLGHLTCGEIQGAVLLLIAAGLDELAAEVVHGHALGDDDAGDVHAHIYEAATESDAGDAWEMSQEFVAACKRGEPVQKFQIVRANGVELDYTTREDRDHDARSVWAERYAEAVTLRSWTPERGWVTDEVIKPQM